MLLLYPPPVDEHSQQENKAEESQSWNHHQRYQPLHTAQPCPRPGPCLMGQVGDSTGMVWKKKMEKLMRERNEVHRQKPQGERQNDDMSEKKGEGMDVIS